MRPVAVAAYLLLPGMFLFLGIRDHTLTSPQTWAPIAGFLLLFLLPVVWTFKTRVVFQRDEILVSEGVFTFQTHWQNLVALILVPRYPALAVREPLEAKAVKRMQRWAAASHASA